MEELVSKDVERQDIVVQFVGLRRSPRRSSRHLRHMNIWCTFSFVEQIYLGSSRNGAQRNKLRFFTGIVDRRLWAFVFFSFEQEDLLLLDLNCVQCRHEHIRSYSSETLRRLLSIKWSSAYGGTESNPMSGLGQGNGAAAPAFSAVSTLLIMAYLSMGLSRSES
jgi:hypothetical protein